MPGPSPPYGSASAFVRLFSPLPNLRACLACLCVGGPQEAALSVLRHPCGTLMVKHHRHGPISHQKHGEADATNNDPQSVMRHVEFSFGPLAKRKRPRRWRPLRTLLFGSSVLLLCLQLHAHLHLHFEPSWQLPADERHNAGTAPLPPPPPRADADDADGTVPPPANAEASSSDDFAAPWLAPQRAALLQAEPSANRTTLGLPAVPWQLHQTWKDAWPPKHLFSPRWRHSMQAAERELAAPTLASHTVHSTVHSTMRCTVRCTVRYIRAWRRA